MILLQSFKEFEVNSQINLLGAYEKLKLDIDIKSVNQLSAKTLNIFLEAIQNGDINKDQTLVVCTTLERIARNIEVIQQSEKSFFSRIFSRFLSFKSKNKATLINIYQADVQLKAILQAKLKAEEDSLKNIAALLPPEERAHWDKAALKAANNNFVNAKKILLRRLHQTFFRQLCQFSKNLKEDTRDVYQAKAFLERPNFAQDAKPLFFAMQEPGDQFEKLDRFGNELNLLIEKQAGKGIGADDLLPLLEACIFSWGHGRSLAFIHSFAQINLEEIEVDRNLAEADASAGSFRAYVWTTIAVLIERINNE